MYHQSRQVWDHLITRRIAVCLLQFVVVIPHRVRHIELHLTDKLTVGVHHLRIEHPSHMQDHIIIGLVFVVAMQIPVRGLVVDLYITHPQRTPDLHLRIEEVRPCVVVMQPSVNHFDGITVACLQFLQGEQFVLKHIMQ